MKKQIILYCLALIVFNSCKKEKYFDGPNFFQDDFEPYSKLNDLLLPDDQLWSFTQQTRSLNFIEVDSTRKHSGHKALKFYAEKSDGEHVSKSSISKHNMTFWEGETVRLSAWYYIEGTQPLEWLFLADLEEQTAIGAGPGMRLALVNDQLRVEHKFNAKDVIQTEGQGIVFPRNEWVHIVWEIKLSQKNKGEIRVWQNDQRIIDRQHRTTLPKDLLYFQQGTKGMYSSCEIGITANSKDSELTIWVDDIKFEKVN